MARNAFALALLMALSLGGCSKISSKLPAELSSRLPWNKAAREAQEAEAKLAALRARTDSLRKARRIADSLAVVRHAACVDSMRAELTRKAAKKSRGKGKKRPSPELIATEAQTSCERAAAPSATVAAAGPQLLDSVKPQRRDSVKPPRADSARTAASPARDSAAAVANRAPAARVDSAQPASGAAPAQPAAIDQSAYADSVRKAKEMEMSRETFAYSGATRDPFVSLLDLAKAGPELAELQLVGIYQNLRTPSGNVAVFREKSGGKRHRLRAGDQLGRSRLVEIRERDVVFVIEDFGFERQETLSLRKQEDVTP